MSAASAPPASAGVPPTGKYQCWGASGWYYNTIKLRTATKYRVVSGGGGRYRYRSGSKKVIFKTGPMKFAYGKHRHASDGTPMIDLYFKSDGSYFAYCFKI